MYDTRFALSNVAESLRFYVQLNNCRVCKHVCAKVCCGNCCRIHACLRASEQLIGFVGMSATRFATGFVRSGLHGIHTFSRAMEQLIKFVRSGLFGIHAFSRAIEQLIGFVRFGLFGIQALSRAIEQLIGFVRSGLSRIQAFTCK